jgi:hypothetical protein
VSDLSFKASKKDRSPLTFDIEGDKRQYTFKPPKTAAMVMPMLDSDDDLDAARAYFAWLDKGLDEEDRAHLLDRLNDDTDDLDFDDLEVIVEGIVEAVSGRPTT